MNNMNIDDLSYIDDGTKSKLKCLLETFAPDENTPDDPQEALMKLVNGGMPSSCYDSVKKLTNHIKMVNFQLLVISNLVENLYDMDVCVLNNPFSIESVIVDGDVQYKCSCTPVLMDKLSSHIMKSQNIPLIINTFTGVELTHMISSDDTPSNALKIDDLSSCMSFLYKNMSELQSLLMNYIASQ